MIVYWTMVVGAYLYGTIILLLLYFTNGDQQKNTKGKNNQMDRVYREMYDDFVLTLLELKEKNDINGILEKIKEEGNRAQAQAYFMDNEG